MAFNIVYKKSVEKDLARLDRSVARRILDRIDADLGTKADSYPALKGEFAGLRKFRVGDYRVIFVIMDDQVQILRIGDRKDVYR